MQFSLFTFGICHEIMMIAFVTFCFTLPCQGEEPPRHLFCLSHMKGENVVITKLHLLWCMTWTWKRTINK